VNKTIITLAISALLFGCQQETPPSDDAVKLASATTTEAEATETTSTIAEKDKLSYALGINMADSISGINKDYKSLGLDMELVKRGFRERLADKAEMSDEDVKQQFMIFQQKMQFAQQQKMQADMAAQTAKNQSYLDENLTKGFTQTESGLQYKEVVAAKEGAAKPLATDKVKVSYKGTFTDGKEFDSNPAFPFSLAGGVIQGWLEGVKLMSVGSKFEFVIPPELAYGSQTRGPIPGGSILKFEIELLEIISTDK
jgi:FKBP-type peptidyl-prolyl cis-trans isomerase FkpA